jgi:hypothetical protein
LSEIAAEFNLPLIDFRSEFLRQADLQQSSLLGWYPPKRKRSRTDRPTIESCLPAIYISLAAMPA